MRQIACNNDVGARYIVPPQYVGFEKTHKKARRSAGFFIKTAAQAACLQLRNIRN